MLRPKYRLQSLLEIRNKAQQDAARVVAVRRAQMAAAEAEMARCNRALVDCRGQQQAARKAMFAGAAEGIEAQELLRHRTYLADLRAKEHGLLNELEEHRAAVARAAAEVEKAITALIEASKESLKIEKHRDAWNERQRREQSWQEQKDQDEMSSLSYARMAASQKSA